MGEAPGEAESATPEENVETQDLEDGAKPHKDAENAEAQRAIHASSAAVKSDPPTGANADDRHEAAATSKALPKTGRHALVVFGGLIAFSCLVYGSFLLVGFLSPEPKCEVGAIDAAQIGDATQGGKSVAAATALKEASFVAATPAGNTNTVVTMSDHTQEETEQK